MSGLLTIKDMQMNTFSGKEEERRKWKEGVERYVGRIMPMLTEKMNKVKDDEMEVAEEDEGDDGAMLMQFLSVKCEVSGYAERILKSLNETRGLEGWRKMWHWYERRVAERGLKAVIDVMAMAAKKAKNVRETRDLLLELDEKLRRATECGKKVDGLSLIHI